MRIGIDATWAGVQGTGTASYTRGLVQALHADRSHHLVLYFRPGDESSNPLTTLRGPHVTLRSVDGRGQVGRNLVSLARAAKRDRVDVFHAPGYFLPLWRGPKVVTFHDVNMFLQRDKWWRPGMRLGWLALCAQTILGSRISDRILADSHHAAQAIARVLRVPHSKISIVYPGVDDRYFTGQSKGQTREMSGTFGRYILSVGVLSPQKNLEGTIRAFHSMGDPDLTLVLAGREDGSYFQDTLLPLITSLGLEQRVRTLGLISDEALARLYAGALVLVHPSFAEGFGLPPLEAMASGLPVVASNTSSLPEILGDAAILVDPSRIEDIAGAVSALCHDAALRERYSRLGTTHAARFRWSETARAAVKVYETVA